MIESDKERLVRAIKDLYFTPGEKWLFSGYKIRSASEEDAWYFALYYEGLELWEDGIFSYYDLWGNTTSLEDITEEIVAYMDKRMKA